MLLTVLESVARAVTWYSSGRPSETEPDVCASRDVFQARLDGHLRQLVGGGWPSDEAALLTAVLGEVGNNCFDHNLGQWADLPGCWFGREPDAHPPLFWLLDRGVGILATLRRADSTLITPQQAVDAAFQRVLSGRAPERRGNGLKFVRSVVNGYDGRGLVCRSGGGQVRFGGLAGALAEVEARLASVDAAGVAVFLVWRLTP